MRKRVSIIGIFFVVLSLLVFLFSSIFPIPFLQGITQQLFSGPKKYLYNLKSNTSDVPQEKKLKEEIKNLEAKLVDYENIKKDNIALRSQFQDSPIPNTELLPVHVVGFIGKLTVPEKLIIDHGSSEGIKVGQSVILGKNFIGLVSTVSPHFAHVTIPTNPAFNLLGKTLQDEAMGIIKGEGDFIILDNVVITDKLHKDDYVVTRGEIKNNDISIPKDLIVGKISSINKTETKPFQNARIEPIVDYSRINLLFIVK